MPTRVKNPRLPPITNIGDYTFDELSDELTKLAGVTDVGESIPATVSEITIPEITPEIEGAAYKTPEMLENDQLAKLAQNIAITRGVSPSANWVWELTNQGVIETITLDSGWKWNIRGDTNVLADDTFVSPEGLSFSFDEWKQIAREGIDDALLEDYAGLTGEPLTREQRLVDIAAGLESLKPEQDYRDAYNYYFGAEDETRMSEFITDVRAVGRSDTTVNLLKSLGFEDKDIETVFQYDNIIKGFQYLFPAQDAQEKIQYYFGVEDADREQEFLNIVKEVGRSDETINLLDSIYGDLTPEQLNSVFQDEGGETKAEDFWHNLLWSIRSTWQNVESGIFNLIRMNIQPTREDIPQQAKLISDVVSGWAAYNLERNQVELEKWKEEHPFYASSFYDDKLNFEAIKNDPSLLVDAGFYGRILAGAIPTIAGVLVYAGTIAITKNPIIAAAASGALFTPLNVQDVYDDMIASGATDEEAMELAFGAGLAISALDVAGIGVAGKAVSPLFSKILKQNATAELSKSMLKTLTKKGIVLGTLKTIGKIELAEVVTENLQQVIQNAVVKTVDANRSLLDGLDETTIQTAFTMLPFGFMGGGTYYSQMKSRLPQNITAQIDTTARELTKSGLLTPDQAEAVAVTRVMETPEGEQSVNQAIELTQQAIDRGEIEERDEGGEVRKAKQAVEFEQSLSPAQRDFRIGKIKSVLAVKGRTKEGKTKPELRLELANLEAQKQIEAEPDFVEVYKQDIENEIQARQAPYHGATKAVDWLKPYSSAQLNEMWKVYDQAVKDREAGAGPGTPKWTEFFRTPEASHDWIKKQLTNYIRKSIPLSERGKLLIQVRDAKTMENLDNAIKKTNEIAEAYRQKILKAEIKKALDKAKLKKNKSGLITGKYGGDYQSEIELVRKSLEGNREEALEKIAANQAEYEAGKITGEEMYERNFQLRLTGLDGMTSSEMQFVLDYINELISVGRAIRRAKIEERKEQMKAEAEEISNVISGGQEIRTGVVREVKGFAKIWEAIENWQLSLTDFLDRLSRLDKYSKPYESKLNKSVDNRVLKSYNAEQDGLVEQHNQVKDNFYRIFETRRDADADDILRRMGREEIALGTFKDLDGRDVNLKLTKGQMIDVYNLLQAPENLPTFQEGNRFSQEMLDAITDKLTTQEKEWAGWMREYLSGYWESINSVYEPLYGVDLGRHDQYWPRNRDVEASDIPEHILVKEDFEHYASVTSGSLKARTNNKIPFKFLDANFKLINHIQQMEHFKAWAFTIRDLRSLFKNKTVQNAIKQYHGQRHLSIINDYINLLARGGIEKSKRNAWLDKIRGNVAVSILGAKPMIGIKQPIAIFGFMTAMPYNDFVSGVADFMRNPIKNYKTLYEKSSLLRSRYRAGQYERDLKVGVEGGAPKSISGKAGWKEFMLTLIQYGDMAGTVPGMWAKYKSELKAGKSGEEAILEAEKLTNRTQNTSALHTLTPIQNGGSVFRLGTMFQDQPNKYFRLINANMHALVNGRLGKAKSLTNIFIVWVIMPALFQFMSDGFRWREDRQLRAWLLGPINDLLIFGEMAQSAVGWATGENFKWEPSPVLQILDDIQVAMSKAMKIKGQMKDPYSNISMDDVIEMIEYLAKGVGMYTGVPTPYLVQVEKALRSGTPINLLYTEWALKDDAPDNETKAEDEIGKLGFEIEQTPAEKATGRKADIYDMKDLENKLTSIYSKVLPSKIKTDNPLIQSWVEKEIIWGTVGILPNVPLKDLIKYDSNGENIVDWYIQWQDRQTITNLADLKGFDKLNPNAYKGNISKREYELVTNYMESTKKDDYLAKHPELNNNLRDDYLKENPKDNALLALWEGTELLSMDAYNELQKLVGDLDIPDAAFKLQLPSREAFERWFAYVDKMSKYDKSISSAKSSLHMSFSSVTEDNLKYFYWDLEYSLLRDKDGNANSKARTAFRMTHRDFDKYGIEQGWWKPLS